MRPAQSKMLGAGFSFLPAQTPSLPLKNRRMARILLIETATEVCSAAIAVKGEVVASAEELHSSNHAALLTLQIEEVVKTAGIPLSALDAVAVSQGPGSYTSLRVGASVAKGICYALDKPLVAVDTLLALAWASRKAGNPAPIGAGQQPTANNQKPETFYVPMLDARRQEVWTAVYDDNLRLLSPARPLILENDLFEKYIQKVVPGASPYMLILSGNGSLKFENATTRENTVFSPVKKCSAQHFSTLAEQIFQNAEFQNAAYFEPFYMKAPNITTPSKSQF